MKTTLDLPDDLMRQIKLRAVHEGKKLKDTVADTLRAGLTATASQRNGSGRHRTPVTRDRKTGLPLIQCRHEAPRGQEITAERVARILNDQEAGWARDAG